MNILELLFAFIVIMAAFAAIIFLYSKLSRLFKKKSYHHIVPPKPENDKNWHPIELSEYECFFFVKNSSLKFILETINGILKDKNKSIYLDSFEYVEEKEWILLKLDKISYANYITAMFYLCNYSENKNYPKNVIGFGIHKKDNNQDFLFKIDEYMHIQELMISTLKRIEKVLEGKIIGSFRDGRNFSIYFPHIGLNEKGNISLSKNNQEVNFHSEISKLPLNLIKKEKSRQKNNY